MTNLRKGRCASAAAFSEAMLRAMEGCVASSGMSMDAPRDRSSEAARRAPAAPAGAGRCAVRASHKTKKAFSNGSTCSGSTPVKASNHEAHHLSLKYLRCQRKITPE